MSAIWPKVLSLLLREVKRFTRENYSSQKNQLLCNRFKKKKRERKREKKKHSASPHGPWGIYPGQMLGGKDVFVQPTAQQMTQGLCPLQ